MRRTKRVQQAPWSFAAVLLKGCDTEDGRGAPEKKQTLVCVFNDTLSAHYWPVGTALKNTGAGVFNSSNEFQDHLPPAPMAESIS